MVRILESVLRFNIAKIKYQLKITIIFFDKFLINHNLLIILYNISLKKIDRKGKLVLLDKNIVKNIKIYSKILYLIYKNS